MKIGDKHIEMEDLMYQDISAGMKDIETIRKELITSIKERMIEKSPDIGKCYATHTFRREAKTYINAEARMITGISLDHYGYRVNNEPLENLDIATLRNIKVVYMTEAFVIGSNEDTEHAGINYGYLDINNYTHFRYEIPRETYERIRDLLAGRIEEFGKELTKELKDPDSYRTISQDGVLRKQLGIFAELGMKVIHLKKVDQIREIKDCPYQFGGDHLIASEDSYNYIKSEIDAYKADSRSTSIYVADRIAALEGILALIRLE